ncbi:MAG: hypothetical protein MG2_0192 [uncultured Candidatus Poseidoniales archaeon]|nr:MAG: hypothetical protein MG2_0192 [uncultured Candidatus Poseidoniales archaeon]
MMIPRIPNIFFLCRRLISKFQIFHKKSFLLYEDDMNLVRMEESWRDKKTISSLLTKTGASVAQPA